MCDLKAFVKKHDGEELLLESVNYVHAEHGEVLLRSLFGEEKKVQGEVREISFAKSRIIVEQV